MSIEIEVITSKKKLSKSIVKQLEPASMGDMEYLASTIKKGYYIRGLGKGYSPRTAIFQGIGRWVIANIIDWKRATPDADGTARHVYDNGRCKSFETTELCDRWWKAYTEMKELCLKNHLIL